MDELAQVQRNIQLLGIALQIIQSLIKEIESRGFKAIGYCDAFTLAAASRILVKRIQTERLKLPPTVQNSVTPPEPPPLPTIPPGKSREVAEAIGDSEFFKTVWPNVKRG